MWVVFNAIESDYPYTWTALPFFISRHCNTPTLEFILIVTYLEPVEQVTRLLVIPGGAAKFDTGKVKYRLP